MSYSCLENFWQPSRICVTLLINRYLMELNILAMQHIGNKIKQLSKLEIGEFLTEKSCLYCLNFCSALRLKQI